MSPRLIGIFAGIVVLLAAAFAYVYVYQNDKIPDELSSLLGKDSGRGHEVERGQRQDQIFPTFDIVRVDASGTAVIAGRGVPGATIVVKANDVEVAREKISKHGEWAVYIDTPFDAGAVELRLEMIMANGDVRRGKQVVVIAVPKRRGEKPLVVLGEPGQPSRVLQNPEDRDETLTLTLDVVDYDAEGSLVLSGRAASGAILRIYMDQDLLGETRASDSGTWTLRPPDPIRAGIYKLRIDQIDGTGHVVMRVELPFERAAPADVLAAVARGGGRLVVQPGNSLWRIARRVYGSGFEYTIIYDANQDQIRDPDKIYAGQILDLPVKHEIDDEIHLLQ